MTTTPRTQITRALRMLGADPDEVPSSTAMANGLEAWNGMLHGWKGKGVDIGHSDMAVDDDISVELDPQFNEGSAALLAITLSAENANLQPTPAIAIIAQRGWEALQDAFADTSIDSDLRVDPVLGRLQANRRWRGML